MGHFTHHSQHYLAQGRQRNGDVKMLHKMAVKMYGSHKIILHTIKRAIWSQCFIDAYCPATVTTESQGTNTNGIGLYGYNPGLGNYGQSEHAGRTCECRLFIFMQGIRPGMQSNAALFCYPNNTIIMLFYITY